MNNKQINKHELIELLQARMIQYHHCIDELMEAPSQDETSENVLIDDINAACAVVTELNALAEHLECYIR